MDYLKMGDIILPYQLAASPRAKRINITVANGQVKVTVPRGTSPDQARRFVEAKQNWIWKHVQDYQKKAPNQPLEKNFEAGEHFLYLGESYPLRIIYTPSSAGQIELNQEGIWLFLPAGLPQADRANKIKAILHNWYKAQARTVFSNKLANYAEQLQVTYHTLRIKEQKTKWGSCSHRANINLNWKLIMAPEAVIDYVLIHELAHLRHMNHSPEFWQVVANCQPAYFANRKWLKEHGKELIF